MSRHMDRLKRSTASAQETWRGAEAAELLSDAGGRGMVGRGDAREAWKRFSASHRLKTFVLSSVKLFDMRRVSSTFEFELMATERATAW